MAATYHISALSPVEGCNTDISTPRLIGARARFCTPGLPLVSGAVGLEVVEGGLDGGDGFGVFVGDFDGVVVGAEFFFEGHDEFDEVEGVGVEVFGEGCLGCDFFGFDAEFVCDDFLYSFEECGHGVYLPGAILGLLGLGCGGVLGVA